MSACLIEKSTCVSWRTYASKSWTFVDASSAVFASAGLASIVFILATDTRVIIGTSAVQARAKVLTTTMMHAWISNAAFRCGFALFAIGTRWTAGRRRIHVNLQTRRTRRNS
jgi:hypothetical protein